MKYLKIIIPLAIVIVLSIVFYFWYSADPKMCFQDSQCLSETRISGYGCGISCEYACEGSAPTSAICPDDCKDAPECDVVRVDAKNGIQCFAPIPCKEPTYTSCQNFRCVGSFYNTNKHF